MVTKAAYDVQDVIDKTPMGVKRWTTVVLCFVIALLDGFDTQSIAFIGPAIADDFGLQATDMTWVITASTIGMCLGAMTLGTFGDRIGRKKTILLALIIFGVFSVAGAFAQTLEQIVILRFLIGLGMGGATPALLALTAEFSPKNRRGTFMTLVLLGLPGGALLGGLVAAAWLPVMGWRGIFLVGGLLPMALLLVCLKMLPESPVFLATKRTPAAQAQARRIMESISGEPVDADAELFTEDRKEERSSIGALFSRKYRMVTVAVFATYLLNWIAWYLLLLWMPTALKTLGLAASQAAMGTVTVNGAFILFAIPLSIILPKVNPRTLLLAMFGAGILVAIGLGLAGSNFALVFVLIGLAGFGIGGQQLALNYLIANAYPTQLRATATGWGIGIGRLGSIVGSALGGLILAGLGVAGYFMALAVPLVLAAVATLLVRASPASRSVNASQPETVQATAQRESEAATPSM
ncbi:AAHS family 4-hydroxybenzoate transporter-like MFS transporter [Pseudarthrobacter defluvii]|uniref:AAHS family 4-hydroxybenzoate transporter-like MFS transporter n=1 Tax=Pseudarthrobacter defluvii TaxID=410837 RepID=A0ABT9UGG4_9MICC|nr:MFS transporter [Pseudarthrobacter defluvii]MDQ0118058.1 AAHS family 4-hydroxybenzoate transporter-like MFS transporter [Pseudarthrobacter defluvii]